MTKCGHEGLRPVIDGVTDNVRPIEGVLYCSLCGLVDEPTKEPLYSSMRKQTEVEDAIAYWRKARDDAAQDPKFANTPVHVLVKGIVWALEWANGRDRDDIINEATKEEWIRKLLP